MNNLTWLLHWYYFQCDGNWEPDYGIKIFLDQNLIWQLAFDLFDTRSMDKEFRELLIEYSSYNWVKSYVYENVFYVQSTLQNFPTSINVFRLAMQGKSEEIIDLPDDFLWFLNWCKTNQNVVSGKVTLSTLENPGWMLIVPSLKQPNSELINREQSEDNWVHCRFENGMFQGYCGPPNLIELFTIFRTCFQ